MKRIVAFLTALLFLVPLLTACRATGKEKFVAYYYEYFDTVTQIIGYADSREEFDAVCAAVKEQLAIYHRAYDIYHSYAGVTNLRDINRREAGDGVAVAVSEPVFSLLTFCQEMHTATGGRTNIAMGSVLSLWHTYRETGIDEPWAAELPPLADLQKAALHTDIANLVLDGEASTVLLADEEMSLDVGAIAKGYAAERVADALAEDGISGYLINLGGNVRAVGPRPDGSGWLVGVENPDKSSEEGYVEYLSITDRAVVTSGVYQRYYTVDGVRYHHIIDPDTLFPGDRYLSVTVIAADSGVGDAFSTALFNMDREEGLALVEATEGLEAMWIFPDGSRAYSSGFAAYRSEE